MLPWLHLSVLRTTFEPVGSRNSISAVALAAAQLHHEAGSLFVEAAPAAEWHVTYGGGHESFATEKKETSA